MKIGDRDGGGFHAAEDATARDLVRQLSMHSYAGGRRVFVLGDVDFTREAANALLKFFEEPPPEVVLLLTTTAVARLLPTVRSRLIEVTFPPLTEREVASILEREGVAPDAAGHAAGLAGGSVTRARALLEGEGTMRDAAVTWFFETLEGGAADSAGWATRPTLEEGLEVVKTLTRDWLALRVGGTGVPLLARDQAERISRVAAARPGAHRARARRARRCRARRSHQRLAGAGRRLGKNGARYHRGGRERDVGVNLRHHDRQVARDDRLDHGVDQ